MKDQRMKEKKTAERHAQMLQIQFVKQPLIMVNFSSKGFKTVVIRELVMAAILFFKISQKIFKCKHYKLIVHWKPPKPILSEIETLLQKTRMQVTVMATPNGNEHILKI